MQTYKRELKDIFALSDWELKFSSRYGEEGGFCGYLRGFGDDNRGRRKSRRDVEGERIKWEWLDRRR